MHMMWWVAAILCALAVLILGLITVLHELLDRTPYGFPRIEDDGLAWSKRYRGSATLNTGGGTQLDAADSRDAWRRQRENGNA